MSNHPTLFWLMLIEFNNGQAATNVIAYTQIHLKPIAGYSSQERNVGLNSDRTKEEIINYEDNIYWKCCLDSDKSCISEAPKVERELTCVYFS
jgi:hypothetical protein